MPLLEYRVLGPVRAANGEREIKLPPLSRLLLAHLILGEGRSLPYDALVQRLWDDSGWGDAGKAVDQRRTNLHTAVSRLRAALREADPTEDDPVPGTSSGYRLVFDAERVDLFRFRSLVRQARDLWRTDPRKAAELGRRALAEWEPSGEGPTFARPLSDVTGPHIDRLRDRLRDEHRRALLDCIEAEVTCGEVTDRLLMELDELAAEDRGRPDSRIADLRKRARAVAAGDLATSDERRGPMEEAADLDYYRRRRQAAADRQADAAREAAPDDEADPESPRPDPGPVPGGVEEPVDGRVSFVNHQYGERARAYQAHTMHFHEGREDE